MVLAGLGGAEAGLEGDVVMTIQMMLVATVICSAILILYIRGRVKGGEKDERR